MSTLNINEQSTDQQTWEDDSNGKHCNKNRQKKRGDLGETKTTQRSAENFRKSSEIKIKKPGVVRNICNASKQTGWRIWSSSPAWDMEGREWGTKGGRKRGGGEVAGTRHS